MHAKSSALHRRRVAGTARIAGLLPALVVAFALAGCGGADEQAASTGSGSTDTAATCSGLLEGFAAGPVCTADASAEGGDTICYQVDDGATTTAVEADDEVFGFQHTPTGGEPRTMVGLTMNSGASEDSDGIALYVEATAQETGTFALGRYSSWSEADSENYRAIGNTAGCGHTLLNTYEIVGGRMRGEFEAVLCAYNGQTHVVECQSGQAHLKGAFDVTRDEDAQGGSATPFITNPYGLREADPF